VALPGKARSLLPPLVLLPAEPRIAGMRRRRPATRLGIYCKSFRKAHLNRTEHNDRVSGCYAVWKNTIAAVPFLTEATCTDLARPHDALRLTYLHNLLCLSRRNAGFIISFAHE